MSTLTLRPNAASTTEQARSDGTDNYECIDEATLAESDYCRCYGGSSSQTLVDIYGFPDHSTESGTINSVTVKAYAKKIIKGTDDNNVTIRMAIDISGNRYFGSANNLTTSTALYSHSYSVNPATSSAWSWTNIDNLLAGDELTSDRIDKDNNISSYVYQLWVEVDYGAATGPVMPVFLYHYMNHC